MERGSVLPKAAKHRQTLSTIPADVRGEHQPPDWSSRVWHQLAVWAGRVRRGQPDFEQSAVFGNFDPLNPGQCIGICVTVMDTQAGAALPLARRTLGDP